MSQLSLSFPPRISIARHRRLRRWLLVAFIVPVIFLSGTSFYQFIASRQDAQTFPAPGKLVDIGGYRLHIYCTGQRINGSPTVVFEGGLGAVSILWNLVQPGVAAHTRACSYDRAGYGWSDPGPAPRTGLQIANELHTLLVRTGERAPFVLVGHSFGGIIIRLYANRYPADVAGLVFVDARQEDFFQKLPPSFLQIDETNLRNARLLQVITPLGITRLAGHFGLLAAEEAYLTPLSNQQHAVARATMFYNPQHWQTSVAERELIQESFDAVRTMPIRRDLPMFVLTAENGIDAWRVSAMPIDQTTRDIWMGLQQALAALSTRSQWVIVQNSGHYIQFDRPEVIIDTVVDNFVDF